MGVGDYAAANQSGGSETLFSEIYHRTPDIQSLAECPEEKLLKLWEGLGYYNRVRNMQEAAKTVKMNIMADCLKIIRHFCR